MVKRSLKIVLSVCALGWLSGASLVAATDAAAVAARVKADPAAREMLQKLTDDFGGRLTGSTNSAGAHARLIEELEALGLKPQTERFTMPGWERGPDEVVMVAPLSRPLRIAALAYTQPTPRFASDVVFLGSGAEDSYPTTSVEGMIGLVDSSARLRGDRLIEIAAERGLRAVLYTNRVGGGQLLARTSSFQGDVLPIPFICIVQEEGRWLQRLVERGEKVTLTVETHSRPKPVEAVNVSLTFPGRDASTIVVGAHFDSWDLGQGALDNGLGVAQLYALARVLKDLSLQHTVELVWFDGEEQGLWGSRIHAEATRDAPIAAMVNLDMVGLPIGVNALGADALLPALNRWHEGLVDVKLPKGVENINWLGSDHTPYQLAGVRSITFNAPIHQESVRYYHDLADTIDKVYPGLIEDSSAVIASLVVTLAEDATLQATRLDAAGVREMFGRFNLVEKVEAMGLDLP